MRVIAAACCAAFCCAVLPGAPAAADDPDSVVPLEPAPVGGDVLGKFCISVPVNTLAQAFAAFFGMAGSGGGAVAGAPAGVQSAASSGAQAGTPSGALPASALVPAQVPAAVPVTLSPAGTQSLAGVPLMAQLLMSAGLPKDLTILEAVPC
ncbi:hypothetical protein OIE67_47845 [Nonomuraea fuscirosea]|uniref:hypothetical protein n=1 Tax=Nonomuraea fuscirosea TaxID=1291556 RepID=UPI002DDA665B|nr:hypothetical protein [Nonomuraea fuscirosea]WSA51676.1 hypothetical protein OIE67_47845 [Nonomuraea fuscirosea]